VKLITPKYITPEIAETAANVAIGAVFGGSGPLVQLLKRKQCCIIVLVPAMEDAREDDYPAWPNYPTQAHLLYEKCVGREEGWEHPYDEIASCKALQLWAGRNDDRTAPIPHLLFSGDTQYWGGVNRRGFVVTCSGVQPWFDKLISGIVSDTIVALAHDAFVNDPEVQKGVDFLS